MEEVVEVVALAGAMVYLSVEEDLHSETRFDTSSNYPEDVSSSLIQRHWL